MPSPFPGMDPYLESPAWWRAFHGWLILNMATALNATLPSGFGANAEERVYLATPKDIAYPDLFIKHRGPLPASPRSGGTAVLDVEITSRSHGVVLAYPETITEPYIVIRTAHDRERVITIIEVLSPANKTPGSSGRTEYLRKQEQALASDTSLLEIDLLRGGAHTVAAPEDRLRMEGTWDYLACLHRPWQRYHFEYWFNRLRDPLPELTVPLLEGMPEVTLNLQEAFGRAYDGGPYKRLLDYGRPPEVALSEEASRWVDEVLSSRR